MCSCSISWSDINKKPTATSTVTTAATTRIHVQYAINRNSNNNYITKNQQPTINNNHSNSNNQPPTTAINTNQQSIPSQSFTWNLKMTTWQPGIGDSELGNQHSIGSIRSTLGGVSNNQQQVDELPQDRSDLRHRCQRYRECQRFGQGYRRAPFFGGWEGTKQGARCRGFTISFPRHSILNTCKPWRKWIKATMLKFFSYSDVLTK